MARQRPALRRASSQRTREEAKEEAREAAAAAEAAATEAAASKPISVVAQVAVFAGDSEPDQPSVAAGDSDPLPPSTTEPERDRGDLTAAEQAMANDLAARLGRDVPTGPNRFVPETVDGSGNSSAGGALDVFEQAIEDGGWQSSDPTDGRAARPEVSTPTPGGVAYELIDVMATRHADAAGLNDLGRPSILGGRGTSEDAFPDASSLASGSGKIVAEPRVIEVMVPAKEGPGRDSTGEDPIFPEAVVQEDGSIVWINDDGSTSHVSPDGEVTTQYAESDGVTTRVVTETTTASGLPAEKERDVIWFNEKTGKYESKGHTGDEPYQPPDGDYVDPDAAEAWMKYLAANGHVRPSGDRGGEVDPNEYDSGESSGGGSKPGQEGLYGDRQDGTQGTAGLPSGGLVVGNSDGNIDWGPDALGNTGAGPEQDMPDLGGPGSGTLFGSDDSDDSGSSTRGTTDGSSTSIYSLDYRREASRVSWSSQEDDDNALLEDDES